jgi:hypothetical protein
VDVVALYLTIALLCYAGFTYGHISDIIHHRGRIAGMIDLSFGISLLWMQSRFLLTVTASNWKLTHTVDPDKNHIAQQNH